MYKMSVNKHR